MAQGLLNPSTNSRLEMETIGSNYFNILLSSSLLQDAKKDDYNRIVSCKMHDLVHDLALDTSKDYCLTLEAQEVNDNIRAIHLSLVTSEHKLLRIPNDICLKLRTLHLVGNIPGELLARLIHLRALILEDFGTEELPRSIKKLKHLRYLDLSRTSIKRLPSSIVKLYHLQTLRLKDLEEIPKNFENLINLRHFYLEDTEQNQLKCNFARIGQLIHLQTLPFFVLNLDFQCHVEELGDLKNLKGVLKIYGLENLRCYEEAIKSNLLSKSNIQGLELHWGFPESISEELNDEEILDFLESTSEEPNDKEILEALLPNSNLKSLLVENFKGSNYPSWMMLQSKSCLVLNNLVKISFLNCFRCEEIPALGHLPHLKSLEISRMPNVKIIASEFYGLKSLNDNHRVAVTVFPARQGLYFSEMSNLVEWQEPMAPSASSIKVFPNLQQFIVGTCPRLTSLPSLIGLTRLQRLNIIGCKNLISLPEQLGSLVSLQFLQIWDFLNLVSLPNFHRLQSLGRLHIKRCENLIALPKGLEMCTSLTFLEIDSCPSLHRKSLNRLTSLNLRCFLIGGFYRLDYFPWPSTSYDASLRNVTNAEQPFASLSYVVLYGWSSLSSLPEQLQHLPALRSLIIEVFSELEAPPEWLGNLASLDTLRLCYCRKLKYLRSAEAMLGLTNLRKLDIYRCPVLGERCSDSSQPEYVKIAHIPLVEIRQ